MDEISPGSSQSRPSISATLSKQPFSNPWDAEHEVTSDPVTEQMLASYANGKQLSGGSFNTPIESSNFNHILESSSQHSLHKSTDEIYAVHDPWTTNTAIIDQPTDHIQSPQNLYQAEAYSTSLAQSQTPRFKEYTQIDEIRVELEKIRSMFGHLNYLVFSKVYGGPVYRRYSEFLWLQEFLIKKYPYRTVTSLPPKKAVGANAVFIEKRRRGLQRFLNFVVNHPIFSKDTVVLDFLTYRKPIQEYRSFKPPDYREELDITSITQEEISKIGVEFDDQIAPFRTPLASHLNQICILLDRFEHFVLKLNEAGNEYLQLGSVLTQVGLRNSCLYPNCEKCLTFEADCSEITNGTSDIAKSLRDQSLETSTVLLESLKSYRDALYGFQLLLQRRDSLLPQLSPVPTLRRVSVNQNRLVEITAKGNVSQKEFDKISNMIEEDKKEAESQRAKLAFLRYCVWEEFDLIHYQKRALSDFIQNSIKSHILYSGEHLQIWSLVVGNLKFA